VMKKETLLPFSEILSKKLSCLNILFNKDKSPQFSLPMLLNLELPHNHSLGQLKMNGWTLVKLENTNLPLISMKKKPKKPSNPLILNTKSSSPLL
jgi:hypothetical protein